MFSRNDMFIPPNVIKICLLQVLKQLSLPLQITLSDEKGDVEKAKRPWEIVPAGHIIGTPVPLFKELVHTVPQLFSFDDYMWHSENQASVLLSLCMCYIV